MKTKHFQTYINQKLQVPKYDGPTGTSTPAGLANKSSKNQTDEVTKNNDKVYKIVNSLNLKVFTGTTATRRVTNTEFGVGSQEFDDPTGHDHQRGVLRAPGPAD